MGQMKWGLEETEAGLGVLKLAEKVKIQRR